jgi:hypothetical protein
MQSRDRLAAVARNLHRRKQASAFVNRGVDKAHGAVSIQSPGDVLVLSMDVSVLIFERHRSKDVLAPEKS